MRLQLHPESHVPRFFSERRRELTPYSWIAQAGCRGVTVPVPQPLFMKSRSARRSKLVLSIVPSRQQRCQYGGEKRGNQGGELPAFPLAEIRITFSHAAARHPVFFARRQLLTPARHDENLWKIKMLRHKIHSRLDSLSAFCLRMLREHDTVDSDFTDREL